MCVYRHTDARMHAQITRVHGYLGEHPTASRPDYQSDPKKGLGSFKQPSNWRSVDIPSFSSVGAS